MPKKPANTKTKSKKPTSTEPAGSDIVDPILNSKPRPRQRKRVRSFCVIWCSETDRLLLERRRVQETGKSEIARSVNEYGLFGGGANKNESPLQNIRRELYEETGKKFSWFDYAVTLPGTKTTIFVKVVKKEFKPKLSFESAGFQWVHDFLDVRPLHSVVAQNYSVLRRLLVACRKTANRTESDEADRTELEGMRA